MTDAFGFSLSYPFSNSESKYGPIIKLAVLILLSFLVIPSFTIFGYILRVREAAVRGDEEIPALVDWIELTKEGFFGTVAILPYTVVAMALLIIPTMVSSAGFVAGETAGSITSSLGFLVGIILYCLALYALPAMITVYSAERDWKSIYSSKSIDFISSTTYALGALMYIGLLIALYIIVGLSSIIVVGLIVTVPFASLARSSFWGSVVRRVAKENNISIQFKRRGF